MRLEELKNDLPETPDFIHNMIQEEVARQTKATNVIPMKKKNKYKWSMGRVAAAAIAVCVMVGGLGTGVYAAIRHFGILDFAGPATIEVSDQDSIHEVANESQAENNTIFDCDVVETMSDDQNITVVYEVSAKEEGKYLFVPEDVIVTDNMKDWGYAYDQSFEDYANENDLSIVFVGGGILNRDEMGIAVVTMDFKSIGDDTMDIFFTCGVTEKPKTDTISIVATGHFQGDEEAMRLESSFNLSE